MPYEEASGQATLYDPLYLYKPSFWKTWEVRFTCLVGAELVLYEDRDKKQSLPVAVADLRDYTVEIAMQPFKGKHEVLVLRRSDEVDSDTFMGEEEIILATTNPVHPASKWASVMKAAQKIERAYESAVAGYQHASESMDDLVSSQKGCDVSEWLDGTLPSVGGDRAQSGDHPDSRLSDPSNKRTSSATGSALPSGHTSHVPTAAPTPDMSVRCTPVPVPHELLASGTDADGITENATTMSLSHAKRHCTRYERLLHFTPRSNALFFWKDEWKPRRVFLVRNYVLVYRDGATPSDGPRDVLDLRGAEVGEAGSDEERHGRAASEVFVIRLPSARHQCDRDDAGVSAADELHLVSFACTTTTDSDASTRWIHALRLAQAQTISYPQPSSDGDAAASDSGPAEAGALPLTTTTEQVQSRPSAKAGLYVDPFDDVSPITPGPSDAAARQAEFKRGYKPHASDDTFSQLSADTGGNPVSSATTKPATSPSFAGRPSSEQPAPSTGYLAPPGSGRRGSATETSANAPPLAADLAALSFDISDPSTFTSTQRPYDAVPADPPLADLLDTLLAAVRLMVAPVPQSGHLPRAVAAQYAAKSAASVVVRGITSAVGAAQEHAVFLVGNSLLVFPAGDSSEAEAGTTMPSATIDLREQAFATSRTDPPLLQIVRNTGSSFASLSTSSSFGVLDSGSVDIEFPLGAAVAAQALGSLLRAAQFIPTLVNAFIEVVGMPGSSTFEPASTGAASNAADDQLTSSVAETAAGQLRDLCGRLAPRASTAEIAATATTARVARFVETATLWTSPLAPQ